MQTLTHLLQQLWGIFFHALLRPGVRPERRLAQDGLRKKSVESYLDEAEIGLVAAVPARRSLCDFPRSLRSRRAAVRGMQSDPADVSFCAWMYYLS